MSREKNFDHVQQVRQEIILPERESVNNEQIIVEPDILLVQTGERVTYSVNLGIHLCQT